MRCREFGGPVKEVWNLAQAHPVHPHLAVAPHSGCLHPFPAEWLPARITSVSPHRSRSFRSQWLGQLHFLFSLQRGISLGSPLKELWLHLHLWVMGLAWPTAEPRGSEHWMSLEEGGVGSGRVCSMASDGCKERKMELAHPYVWRLGFLSQPWTLLIKDLWAQRCQKLLSGNNDNEIRGVCVCVCVGWGCLFVATVSRSPIQATSPRLWDMVRNKCCSRASQDTRAWQYDLPESATSSFQQPYYGPWLWYWWDTSQWGFLLPGFCAKNLWALFHTVLTVFSEGQYWPSQDDVKSIPFDTGGNWSLRITNAEKTPSKSTLVVSKWRLWRPLERFWMLG